MEKSFHKNCNSTPLVTIAVITYNSAKFVFETLESVKLQTYQNIEIIISDDCSKDETIVICEKWISANKERFVNTKIITVDHNTGIPANCNRGVNAAKGIWLKAIAGDDALLPHCIEENLRFLTDNPDISILFSFSKLYFKELNEKSFLHQSPTKIPFHFFNDKITALQQHKMLLIKDRIATTATSFIKREIFDNYKFDESYRLIEDYPFWLKITKAGYKLYIMPVQTIMHRKHDDSVHNTTKNVLISPGYFRNEELRRELVYPNLSWKYRMGYQYKFLVSSILVKVFNNRLHPLSKSFKIIFLNYLNPLVWLEKTDRSIKYS